VGDARQYLNSELLATEDRDAMYRDGRRLDFEGWFLTGDGTRVDPLTVSDAASRYLLVCRAVGRAEPNGFPPNGRNKKEAGTAFKRPI
jgi:hypothetical protein